MTTENITETEATARLAFAATIPEELNPGTIYATTNSDGDTRVINTDDYAPHPRRKTGEYTITNVDHFIAYLAKHGTSNTELWGSPNQGTIQAVINAHATQTPGWEDHTTTLLLTRTNDWNAWNHIDRQWHTQTDFAEFVEDHLPSFITPTAADMLELAQHFKANRSVEFESGKRTKSGATTLVYRETDKAKAGIKGDLDIPDRLELKIAPYEGFNQYPVTARFRYRIINGQLGMSIALERPHDILNAAFEHVTAQITDETNRDIWHTT